jgi:hypothetical protein
MQSHWTLRTLCNAGIDIMLRESIVNAGQISRICRLVGLTVFAACTSLDINTLMADEGVDAAATQYTVGSFRDNDILRMAIANGAWLDAHREFERVWQLRREELLPYTVKFDELNDRYEKIGESIHIVRPTEYSALSRVFALDYAWFLKQRGDSALAQSVLWDVLMRIDLDRFYDDVEYEDVVPGDSLEGLPPQKEFSHDGRSRRGISRESFIRGSCEILSDAPSRTEIQKELRTRIAAGEHKLARVLAQFYRHCGEDDTGLTLELHFIATNIKDPLSAAFRRALVFESFGRLDESAVEFETVLQLVSANQTQVQLWNLPEHDIGRGTGLHLYSQRDQPAVRQSALQRCVRIELSRLSNLLGYVQLSLELQRDLASEPEFRFTLEFAENMRRIHAEAGKSEELTAWARQQLRTTTDEWRRVHLLVIIEDWSSAANILGRYSQPYAEDHWKKCFRNAGTVHLREFLLAQIGADPTNAGPQLELIELDGIHDDQETIERLERILQPTVHWGNDRWKGNFRRPFDTRKGLAIRLKHIYERRSDVAALARLDQRLASGDLCDFSDSMRDTQSDQSRTATTPEGAAEDQSSNRNLLSYCERGFQRSMRILLALPKRRVDSVFCTSSVDELREFAFGDNDLMTITENQIDRICLSAASRHPTQVLMWFLYDPPQIESLDDDDPKKLVVDELVASVRRDQATVDFLLAYRDFSNNDEWNARNSFIGDLFRMAGSNVLPKIHQALKNSDYLIRGNAAFACEEIGDPSSVVPLAEAIRLGSQYSRSRILSALKELPRSAALPALWDLYAETAKSELHFNLRGLGQYGGGTSEGVYEPFDSLELTMERWEFLCRQNLSPQQLLDDQQCRIATDEIFELIEEADIGLSQTFFRSVVLMKVGSDFAARIIEHRRKAVRYLCNADRADRELNIEVLRNSLKNHDHEIRTSAAVSLIRLGNNAGQATVLEELRSFNADQTLFALCELGRLNATQSEFARDEVLRINNRTK